MCAPATFTGFPLRAAALAVALGLPTVRAAGQPTTNLWSDDTYRFKLIVEGDDVDTAYTHTQSHGVEWDADADVTLQPRGWLEMERVIFWEQAIYHRIPPHGEPINRLEWPPRREMVAHAYTGGSVSETRWFVFRHDQHTDHLVSVRWILVVGSLSPQITSWGLFLNGYHNAFVAYHYGRAPLTPQDPSAPLVGLASALLGEPGGPALYDVVLTHYTPAQILGGSIATLDGSYTVDLGPGTEWTDWDGQAATRLIEVASTPPDLAMQLHSETLAVTVRTTDPANPSFIATLVPIPPDCRPDIDGDGFITGDDFELFVTLFEAGDPRADYDGDGFVTGDDFFAFVTDFETGC